MYAHHNLISYQRILNRSEIAIFSSSSEICDKYVKRTIFLIVILKTYRSKVVFFQGTQYVSNAVKIPSAVFSVISPGMFGRVLSTCLTLVPRILWIVAICMTSSFSLRGHSIFDTDALCLFNNEKGALEFFQYINEHSNIRFTMQTEVNCKIPFLDVLLDNCDSNPPSVVTSVFPKITYIGLLTNFLSFAPFANKLKLIRTLVDGSFKINNTWSGFHKKH